MGEGFVTVCGRCEGRGWHSMITDEAANEFVNVDCECECHDSGNECTVPVEPPAQAELFE